MTATIKTRSQSKKPTRTIATQTDTTSSESESKNEENDGGGEDESPQPIQIIIHNHQSSPSKTKRKYNEVKRYLQEVEEDEDEDEDDDEDDEEDDYDYEDSFIDDDESDEDFEIELELDDSDEDFDDDGRLQFMLDRLNDEQLNNTIREEASKDKHERYMTQFVEKSTMQDLKYFKSLDHEERLYYAKAQNELDFDDSISKPIKFKLLQKKMNPKAKVIIYKKLQNLMQMSPSNGEYHKLKSWIETLCDIPFGKYQDLPVSLDDGETSVTNFLKESRTNFDELVFGHSKAKDQLLRIIAQWISNPSSRGNVIGIHGPPGVGKTTLIKHGLSKILKLPFDMIPLGGAHDSSFLDGHSFTYEGSVHGRIVQSLLNTGSMNPVLYLDEIDKISDSAKGQEIINVLIHLTDPQQNDSFQDKYFAEIPFDLSRALIVFTYNDDGLINPILKDRMIRIQADGYSNKDKLTIAKNHLIPDILGEFNIDAASISFSDDIVKFVISRTDDEAGVRNLKRSFESIISNLNISRLMGELHFPITVDEEIVKKYIQHERQPTTKIPTMYV